MVRDISRQSSLSQLRNHRSNAEAYESLRVLLSAFLAKIKALDKMRKNEIWKIKV